MKARKLHCKQMQPHFNLTFGARTITIVCKACMKRLKSAEAHKEGCCETKKRRLNYCWQKQDATTAYNSCVKCYCCGQQTAE